MTEFQNPFSSNYSVSSNIMCIKTAYEKTSVEDLTEEGYTIGSVLGEGSYSKIK